MVHSRLEDVYFQARLRDHRILGVNSDKASPGGQFYLSEILKYRRFLIFETVLLCENAVTLKTNLTRKSD